ncbi:MAG: DUF2116 family Zn-ribbon domain-containing protein [Lachnospirales bacterium]
MKISQLMDISHNTVKSFCQRNHVAKPKIIKEVKKEVISKETKDTEVINTLDSKHCVNCGKAVEQMSGRKLKKFCSDSCRKIYWKDNQFNVNRKSATENVCPVCSKKYIDYAKNNRKRANVCESSGYSSSRR